jgi:uncharacterized coiled-coil protein SlyX
MMSRRGMLLLVLGKETLEERVARLERTVAAYQDSTSQYQPAGQEQWFGFGERLHELERRIVKLEKRWSG